MIEVTTFRSDAYAQHSRKPVVAFGDTLDGDLVRRDFTVNAMAVSIPGKVFHDPYGGLSRPGPRGDPDARRDRRSRSATTRCG